MEGEEEEEEEEVAGCRARRGSRIACNVIHQCQRSQQPPPASIPNTTTTTKKDDLGYSGGGRAGGRPAVWIEEGSDFPSSEMIALVFCSERTAHLMFPTLDKQYLPHFSRVC